MSEFFAWHASPNHFQIFDPERIGTCDGRDSFGHGFYVVEMRSDAEAFAQDLAGRSGRECHLYLLGIDADREDFLIWDLPLPEQPVRVKSALCAAAIGVLGTDEEFASKIIQAIGGTGESASWKGWEVYGMIAFGPGRNGYRDASKVLHDYGIQGVSAPAKHRSDNRLFVVFDADIIRVVACSADPEGTPDLETTAPTLNL